VTLGNRERSIAQIDIGRSHGRINRTRRARSAGAPARSPAEVGLSFTGVEGHLPFAATRDVG
jgi:hypothetical protein